LPIPGSPSISTELPRPPATSVMNRSSVAISLSRPTSAPARVAVGTERILLLEHYGHKWRFGCKEHDQIRHSASNDINSVGEPCIEIFMGLSVHDHVHLTPHDDKNILVIENEKFHY
jgi:hypothetical protein